MSAVHKLLLILAIILCVINAAVSDDPARLTATIQLPRAGDEYAEVLVRGTLKTFDASTTQQATTIKITTGAQEPLLVRGSFFFFTNTNYDPKAPQHSEILSKSIENGVETDISELVQASPYKFAKDEVIYFTSTLFFQVATTTIDPEHLLEYIATFQYCFGDEGTEQTTKQCTNVMFTTYSSKKTPTGAWIDPTKTPSTANYFIRTPATKNELNVMLEYLPFSNKNVVFAAAGHTILSVGADVKCTINGIDTPVTREGDNFSLTLEPSLAEFAVLYDGDYNLICTGVRVQELAVGDKRNQIYLEFIDILKGQPTAIVIDLLVHSLPLHSPYFTPNLLLGSRPEVDSNNSITCAFNIEFNQGVVPFADMNGDTFQISLESIAALEATVESVSAILSGATSTEAPDEYRKTVFKHALSPTAEKEYIFTLDLPKEALGDKDIKQNMPYLLSYTFLFTPPEKPTPQPLVMPQCFLTYRYADQTTNRIHQVHQTIMNAIGNPITSDGAIAVIEVAPVHKGPSDKKKKDQWNFDFHLNKISSGFAHLALDFPQEEYYFNGNYTCKLKQTIEPFPTPDKPKPEPIITEHTIVATTRHGVPMVTSEKPVLTTYWPFPFQAGASYAMTCPDMFLEQGPNVLNSTDTKPKHGLTSDGSFDASLIAFYGYEEDDIDKVRFYSYSSKIVHFSRDTSNSHTFIIVICVILAVLVCGFVGWAVYSRSKKQQASQDQTQLLFQDEYNQIN